MAEHVDLKRTLLKRTMIHILNLDRKEYLQIEGTLSEVSGTSAKSFPLFHLMTQDFKKVNHPTYPFQGLWANQRIAMFESSPPNLTGYTCLNASFGLPS